MKLTRPTILIGMKDPPEGCRECSHSSLCVAAQEIDDRGRSLILCAVALSAVVLIATPLAVGWINNLAAESSTNVSEESRTFFFSMASDVVGGVLIGAVAIFGLARPLLERGLDLRTKARRIRAYTRMRHTDANALDIAEKLL